MCRPPGHHVGPDFLGGYCFVNNAAVATQAFLDGGTSRVAILNVDYRYGNGTQAIFYERADVLFQSIHGDPKTEYPFYLGHADETGAGFNQNYPLAAGSSNEQWFATVVISLGVDTYVGDPISKFKLDAPEFRRMGAQLVGLGRQRCSS